MTFSKTVYEALRKVPKGKITTYKDLAHVVGTRNYRAVGQALKRNPYAPEVPCHRVITSDGSIGGFQGETQGPAIQQKINLLRSEGILIEDNKIINFDQMKFMWG